MRFLETASRDTADRDLAEGLTDEIIARLSQVPGLQVSSRYATLRYRGRRADPAQVGRELGVKYVIDGTLRRTPSGVPGRRPAVDEAQRLVRWPRRYYLVAFRRHWYWAPVRADPRFQAFLAGLQR